MNRSSNRSSSSKRLSRFGLKAKGRHESIVRTRPKQQIVFAVCINDKKYEASLDVGKLYRIIPDDDAESHGYLRVVDESGEDYGYSADRFYKLDVPRPLERVLLHASS